MKESENIWTKLPQDIVPCGNFENHLRGCRVMINKKITPYIKKNKTEVVVYVRGDKKEIQEILCRLCAINKGYEVILVTDDIDEVKNCDVLLTTNPSRINEDESKYNKILKEFKKKRIKIEFVVEYDGLIDDLELVYLSK